MMNWAELYKGLPMLMSLMKCILGRKRPQVTCFPFVSLILLYRSSLIPMDLASHSSSNTRPGWIFNLLKLLTIYFCKCNWVFVSNIGEKEYGEQYWVREAHSHENDKC